MNNHKQQENQIMTQAIHKATREVLNQPQFHAYQGSNTKRKQVHGIKRFMKFIKLLWIMAKEPKIKKKASTQELSPNDASTEQSIPNKQVSTPQLSKEAKTIKNEIKTQSTHEQPQSIQTVINKLESLIQDIDLTPALSRKQIIKIYYKAYYDCNNIESLPEDLEETAWKPMNAFDESGILPWNIPLSILGASDADIKAKSKSNQLAKKAQDIQPKYLKQRIQSTIDTLKDKISTNITTLLSKRVMMTSEDTKSIGLSPTDFQPITRISNNSSGTDESFDAIKDDLREEAITKGGNALVNVTEHNMNRDSDDLFGHSKIVLADVIEIKGKKLYQGNYGKDWQNNSNLLQDLLHHKA